MFKDIVNNKYLVFRAILESITDTITPEFTDTRFIGRPDKVYTYSGTDRSVSFGFKVYPKTKQELRSSYGKIKLFDRFMLSILYGRV